jgi:hypothetical protein
MSGLEPWFGCDLFIHTFPNGARAALVVVEGDLPLQELWLDPNIYPNQFLDFDLFDLHPFSGYEAEYTAWRQLVVKA